MLNLGDGRRVSSVQKATTFRVQADIISKINGPCNSDQLTHVKNFFNKSDKWFNTAVNSFLCVEDYIAKARILNEIDFDESVEDSAVLICKKEHEQLFTWWHTDYDQETSELAQYNTQKSRNSVAAKHLRKEYQEIAQLSYQFFISQVKVFTEEQKELFRRNITRVPLIVLNKAGMLEILASRNLLVEAQKKKEIEESKEAERKKKKRTAPRHSAPPPDNWNELAKERGLEPNAPYWKNREFGNKKPGRVVGSKVVGGKVVSSKTKPPACNVIPTGEGNYSYNVF